MDPQTCWLWAPCWHAASPGSVRTRPPCYLCATNTGVISHDRLHQIRFTKSRSGNVLPHPTAVGNWGQNRSQPLKSGTANELLFPTRSARSELARHPSMPPRAHSLQVSTLSSSTTLVTHADLQRVVRPCRALFQTRQ